MREARLIPKLIVGLVAFAGGCTAGHQLLRAEEQPQPIPLTEAAGRGLEKPWWESITIEQQAPELPVTLVIPNDVLFATDSAVIDEDGRRQLTDLAHERMLDARAVVIAGATDSRGSHEHNLQLSQARADAAKAVLIETGIDAALIRTEAWGENRPVADESGPDPATAQAQNRRVEISVAK